MSCAPALVWLLLITPQQPLEEAPAARRPPGPEEPVAGLDGFFSRSLMLFPGYPDLPHVLEAAYVFPDRARWHRKLLDSPPGVRDVEYRHGERAFALPQGTPRSEELDAARADLTLLRMELRRAAMLWPAGFAWREGAGEDRRTCEVLRSAGGDAIGTFEARLDAEGRPREILSHDGDAVARDGLEIGSWRTEGGRTWPAEMRWYYGDETTWTETVESVATRVRFLDVYFLPPDRRPATAERGRDPVTSIDLVAVSFLRIPLADGLGWDEARERHAAAREEAARTLGPERPLDPTPTFEVSDAGLPTALLVRLESPVDPAPAGWTTRAERAGLAHLGLAAPPAAVAGRLALLRARLPGGARAGTPYVRLHESGDTRRLFLYLPLEAAAPPTPPR